MNKGIKGRDSAGKKMARKSGSSHWVKRDVSERATTRKAKAVAASVLTKSDRVAAPGGGEYRVLKQGKKETVSVPLEEYRAMFARLEDKADEAAYDRAMADESAGFPADVAERLIDGENPVKVIREWRGMTQTELATAVGSKPAYISQIETGNRAAGTELLRKLAGVLSVTVDDLLD